MPSQVPNITSANQLLYAVITVVAIRPNITIKRYARVV